MTPAQRPPNLIMLVGPNGAGKSTLFRRRLAKWGIPFVNPDVIALEIAPGDPANAALRAAREADVRKRRLLDERQTFITEGIRPDLELLAQANRLGYFTRVLYIGIESADQSAARVTQRVSVGGHSVPMGSLAARYRRSLEILPEAVKAAGQLILIDNGRASRPHRFLARFQNGRLVVRRRDVPDWAASLLESAAGAGA